MFKKINKSYVGVCVVLFFDELKLKFSEYIVYSMHVMVENIQLLFLVLLRKILW